MLATSKIKSDDSKIYIPQVNNSIQSKLIRNKNFCLEIDRLFLCVEKKLEVISILQEFGLYCPNTIVQSDFQGTLSKIFFFENIYLEIIWLENGQSQSQLSTDINFSGRADWKRNKLSPFGIGLSRKQQNNQKLNLDSNLIDDLVIYDDIYYSEQNQKNALEPFIFILPDRLKYSNIFNPSVTEYNKYTDHPLGVKQITDIKIILQKGKRRDSRIITSLKNNNLLDISRGFEPLLELTFDRGVKGQVLDARPTIPILLRY